MNNTQLVELLNSATLALGLQSGPGSYNDLAARYYLGRAEIKNFRLSYFHSTRAVLKELQQARIDVAQFAIHNSIAGMVRDSLRALAEVRCRVLEEFSLQISHCLMIHPNANLNQIETLICHPQVFQQCAQKLRMNYPRLRLLPGSGELSAQAYVAEKLGRGELAQNIGTIGAEELAARHGLKIIEKNLQDRPDNFTTFLWVGRG